MNKIEIIILPQNLKEIEECFSNLLIENYCIIDLLVNSSSINSIRHYRGAEYRMEKIPHIKVECIINNDICDKLLEKLKAVNTKSIVVYKLEKYSL